MHTFVLECTLHIQIHCLWEPCCTFPSHMNHIAWFKDLSALFVRQRKPTLRYLLTRHWRPRKRRGTVKKRPIMAPIRRDHAYCRHSDNYGIALSQMSSITSGRMPKACILHELPIDETGGTISISVRTSKMITRYISFHNAWYIKQSCGRRHPLGNRTYTLHKTKPKQLHATWASFLSNSDIDFVALVGKNSAFML